jgi:hypothetical protein
MVAVGATRVTAGHDRRPSKEVTSVSTKICSTPVTAAAVETHAVSTGAAAAQRSTMPFKARRLPGVAAVADLTRVTTANTAYGMARNGAAGDPALDPV